MALENGKYLLTACIGDSGHEKLGQKIVVEGTTACDNQATAAGRFHVVEAMVEVHDGRLTIDIGSGKEGCNTCLNWLVLRDRDKSPAE